MTDQLRAAAQQALEALEIFQAAGQRTRQSNNAITGLRSALAQQAEPGQTDTCTWWQDGDSDSGLYQTSCRNYFAITDGTPKDNEMRHCCYCGKKLTQELIAEDDGE